VSGGVIVTLPQQVSLDDARRGLEMFRQLDIPIFGVVENMSYLELPNGDKVDVFGAGGGKKLAEASGVDYIGGIPMDPAVRLGGDTGMPVLMSAPQSPVSQALRTISEEVAWRVTQAALAQQDQAIPINIVG
jgi:ATP-binding protein involved in chromosome partitioning